MEPAVTGSSGSDGHDSVSASSDSESEDTSGSTTDNETQYASEDDEAQYASEDDDDTGPVSLGTKRPVDVDLASENSVFPKVKKGMDGSRQRLKAGDFDDITKGILTAAASIFRCLIVTRAPFPESIMVETKLAKEAWKEACHVKGVAIKLTPSLVKIVSDYMFSCSLAH